MKYDFASIEKKWQQKWLEEKPFTAVTGDKTREKFFGLIEFPYPSGQGLHVGHARPFTAMDIICRKKRMQGYNVLFPIGFDAFGLPTENYAIKNHVHPAGVTKKNIDHFREQLKRIGLPDEVLVEIVEFRRMRSFGAQRRQLQLIGKKMRNMDPVAVREAIDRVTGESRAAVALLHRCETLRDQMLAGDEALTKFISEHPEADIPRLRTLVRTARKEREAQKPPKSARELYRYLHDLLEEPISLFAEDDENEE